MTLIASAETARVNRRRGTAPDGVTFWHTLYLGTTRYNMAPGTPDPAPDALFPMAFLVEQDPGSTARRTTTSRTSSSSSSAATARWACTRSAR